MSDLEQAWMGRATDRQLARERERVKKEKAQSYRKRRRYENLEHARDEVATIGTMAEFKHCVKHRIPFHMIQNAGTLELKGEWDRMNKRYTVVLRKVPFLIWDHQWYVADACIDSAEFVNNLAPNALSIATIDMFRLREHGIAGVAVGAEIQDRWGRIVEQGTEFKANSMEKAVAKIIDSNTLTRKYIPQVKGKRR